VAGEIGNGIRTLVDDNRTSGRGAANALHSWRVSRSVECAIKVETGIVLRRQTRSPFAFAEFGQFGRFIGASRNDDRKEQVASMGGRAERLRPPRGSPNRR